LRVVDLPYEASVEQLLDFFTDEVLPLNGLLLGPLLDWSGIGVNLQIVLNHLHRDPRQLRRLPGKHVDITPEEGDEHEFLFAIQIIRDTDSRSSLSPDLDGLYGDIFLARGLHAGCGDRAALARARWRGVLAPGSPAASRATAKAQSFCSAHAPASRSPRILRTPLGDVIFRTRYP
jgi:hypothetical protein